MISKIEYDFVQSIELLLARLYSSQLYPSQMKTILTLIILASSFCINAQEDYKATIENHRAEKDVELQSKKTSPLQKADRKTFEDLPYFEIDEKWNLPVKFRVNETQEIIEIPTSAGFSKTFKAYGLLAIHIDGDYFPLTAYKRVLKEGQEHSDHPTLFVPFKDLTTGGSTYGGGRYMDIEIPEDDSELYLDFNLCYSPYCAYGDGFACPIPPSSNFIKAEVTAGEKKYEKH